MIEGRKTNDCGPPIMCPDHEEEVIAGSSRKRDFAQRNATRCGEVHCLVILNDPAARGELGIDGVAGE